MIVRRLHSVFYWLIAKERCPHKLALSFCFGVYIAFSPFVGLHTAMVFLFGWLFALNTSILLGVSMFINNPWTMVPVYGFGHVVGTWLFRLLSIDVMSWNPGWINSCNVFLHKHLGASGISLGAFMVGGNLLGIGIGAMLYPVVKGIFVKHFLHEATTGK